MTDSELAKATRSVEAFFDKYIDSLGDKEQQLNRWFSGGPENQKDSYWKEPSQEAFFKVHSLELESLDISLGDFWESEPDLRALSGPIKLLADDIRRVELHEEISPFVYAMF